MSTDLVLLGTGTPNADPLRSGPAVAVVVNDIAYLIDAGPGLVRRAAAAQAEGIPALAPEQLARVFLTHLHSDHTVGLPDLLLSPWVLGRCDPLHVYGPPGTEAMVEHLIAAYRCDIEERLSGLEPANTSGCHAVVHEIGPGTFRDEDGVQIEAIPVQHGALDAFGYKFTSDERTIVVSGDTTPCEALVDAATDCDVLLHEVYSTRGFATLSPEWQRYHVQSHTSSAQLAAIALRARPRLLVLYHQLHWGTSDEALLKEIRQHGYEGELRSGEDLGVY
jgi:ribonuclease BN (tRNA processing enzyme)